MPKFLADENFDGNAFREIKRLFITLEFIRVQDLQLQGAEDELILEWAAVRGYVLLTHDVSTMTIYAYDRMSQELPFPGMVVVRRHSSIGRMVRELEIRIACTREDEWENRIEFVPF